MGACEPFEMFFDVHSMMGMKTEKVDNSRINVNRRLVMGLLSRVSTFCIPYVMNKHSASVIHISLFDVDSL